jgi:hypothetical protein
LEAESVTANAGAFVGEIKKLVYREKGVEPL